MRLLLISNSTNAGEAYLDHARENIRRFLGAKEIKALFIPYAAVTFSYDEYEKRVRDRFTEIGHDIISIHHFDDPVKAVENAPAIVTGGGNTWMLLKCLQKNNLIKTIREKVNQGTPYIGWSAGANVACPAISTTNDMPVVRPENFAAFGFVPFQINPHYLDLNPAGHAGETREQRILEYIEVNPGTYVVGLREGSILHVNDNNVSLLGPKNARIFVKGYDTLEVNPGDDISFLFKKPL